MMLIKDLFKKDITRSIEGVIKADDLSNLREEVNEYVFTEEVCQNLSRHCLPEYLQYRNANGVWISGFFGSGKSHLLKMLSLLLENRLLDGAPVLDIFKEKLSDELLKADLTKAAQIPSKSILFNIFQKHVGIGDTGKTDPVLAIFLRVFNEALGYYGAVPRIAQMERDLEAEGLYERFKETFQKIDDRNRDWIKRRERTGMARVEIIAALAEVKGVSREDAAKIYDGYADFAISIEDFAHMVRHYVDTREKGFRLNFFADEVGKFCEGNTDRMYSLQTITESLATICRGQSFVFVTSQDDIQAVVGEFTRSQKMDFSKIQDRFRNRLNLTSRNVDEVIHKRLLEKKPEVAGRLSPVYQREKNNFRTLFDFSEGGYQYKHFQDEGHFIDIYPFVPYQFDLFQQSINQLFDHNAFQKGPHQSVGERSMLSAIQDAVKNLGEEPVGKIASFDKLFDGIRPILRVQIQQSIINAEKNLDDPLQIRILKALFMVKYVRAFTPTLKHITTLLIDDYSINLPELEKKVAQALNGLVYQSYVQSNSGQYEFLTEKEKDIIEEIKNTEVDEVKVSLKLGEIVFDRILNTRKLAHQKSGREFAFTQYVDEHTRGREQTSGIGIRLISPLHPHYDNRSILASHALGRDELHIILPATGDYLSDIRFYLQADEYIRMNTSHVLPDEDRGLLETEQRKNLNRWNNLKDTVANLLSQADLVLNGNDLSVSGTQSESRISQAFQQLIDTVYYNLMIFPHQKSQQEVLDILALQNVDGMFDESLDPAEVEVFNLIRSRENTGVLTVKEALTGQGNYPGFSGKPYGWAELSILYLIARLFKKGKIDILENNAWLDARELASRLTNNRAYPNLVLRPVKDVPVEKVNRFKQFYREFLLTAPQTNDAKALAQEFKELLSKEINQITRLLVDKHKYPFLTALEPGLQKMDEIAAWSWSDLLEKIGDYEDVLLDFREDIYDKILRFKNSTQIRIFDHIEEFIHSDSTNLKHIDPDALIRLQQYYDDAGIYNGSKLQEAKTLLDQCRSALQEKIIRARQEALQEVEEMRDKIIGDEIFQHASPTQQQDVRKKLDAMVQELQGGRFIDTFRSLVAQTHSVIVPDLVRSLQKDTRTESGDEVEYMPIHKVKVSIGKMSLMTDQDIDAYTGELNKKLKLLLKKNKYTTLN
jgi:copper chaperone CopZ